MIGHRVVFGPFRLDLRDERLWRGADVVPLTNKAFAVLKYLVEHPAELVTRDALLQAVWSRTCVTDAALAMCIRELRQALGDEARAPRFVETVRGRGYRFIAPLVPVAAGAGSAQDPSPETVGREAEIGRLETIFESVSQARRHTVFISGEAGIGKTTLVDRFVARLEYHSGIWVGCGQCIDHHGPSEPYLPILASLGQICREAGDNTLTRHLRQLAPSWLAQLPAFLTEEDVERLRHELAGVTPQRMLRELADAMEVLSAQCPIVFVFEDLHWCDQATLEWLAYVTRRRNPARLMIVGTYRPVDAIVREHGLRGLVQELKQQTQCTEFMLDYLSEGQVSEYLTRRFHRYDIPDPLATFIYRRCGGNPLFMRTIVDALPLPNILAVHGHQWTDATATQALACQVPENLRLLIEQQFDHLDSTSRALLEAASVVGPRFSAASLAWRDSTDSAIDVVDRQCAELSRHSQFIRSSGSSTWPDGTLCGSYEFIHGLYQEVLYNRIPPAPRARLHRQIGLSLEAGYGPRAAEISVELATHFVSGLDPGRAAKYLMLAGERALRRGAYQEVITGLTLGLQMLEKLPETADRAQRELEIQSKLGAAYIAMTGYAWPQTVQAFVRCRELCGILGGAGRITEALFGVCLFHLDRGELTTAREIAGEALESGSGDIDMLLAHRLLGTCLLFSGELAEARRHLECALDLYLPDRHRHLMILHATDVKVSTLCWLNRVLCLQGYAEQALDASRESIALAVALDHPHSLAFALRDSCFIHEFYRDQNSLKSCAEKLIALADKEAFSFELAEGHIHHGWMVARSAASEDGIVEMEEGLRSYRATGSEFQLPYLLALCAQVYDDGGRTDLAMGLLDQAVERIDKTGECWFEAEIHRLKGEIWRALGDPHTREARKSFRLAMDIARRQGARALELRAVVSMARHDAAQGRIQTARSLLLPMVEQFSTGFCPTDLAEARMLAESLEA